MEDFIEIKVPDEYVVSFNQTCGHTYLFLSKKNAKEEKWQPQDGDIVAYGNDGIPRNIGIYWMGDHGKSHSEHATLIQDGEVRYDECGWTNKNLRPATDEEKQRLFDALAKAGKRWNAEKKRVEDLPRWRAEEEDTYYYIGVDAEVEDDMESGCEADDACHSVGNYFKTREAAERVAAQIREIFKNSKAE